MNDKQDFDAHDEDPGEPIPELVELRQPGRPNFMRRLRAKIQRRMVASQSMDLAVPVLMQTLLEYLSMIMSVVAGPNRDRRKDS